MEAKNPLSAVQYIGAGMDAKKAIFGLAPLFKLTYTGGKTWISPHTKTTYNVPDQLIVSNDYQVHEQVLQDSYQTYDMYLKTYVSYWNFNISASKGDASLGFKYNHELGTVKCQLQNTTKTMMHGDHSWYFYVANMYPPSILKLDPMFELAIEDLPKQVLNSSDKQSYTDFVTTFGTHFTYRALFGAKVNFNTFMSNSFANKYSKQWTNTQYGLYFHYKLFNISADGYKNQSDIKVSEEFLKSANASVNFYGGDPSFAHLDNLTDWTETIEQFTYPINTTVTGIWELVKNNPLKQKSLYSFVNNYINEDTL